MKSEPMMKRRTFRAGEEWDQALAKARAEHTDISSVLRKALREYVRNKA